MFIFKAVKPNVRQTVPFVMTFKIDDKVKKCSGEVTMFPESEGLKTSYGKPLSSHNPYLTWTPSEGLPMSCATGKPTKATGVSRANAQSSDAARAPCRDAGAARPPTVRRARPEGSSCAA